MGLFQESDIAAREPLARLARTVESNFNFGRERVRWSIRWRNRTHQSSRNCRCRECLVHFFETIAGFALPKATNVVLSACGTTDDRPVFDLYSICGFVIILTMNQHLLDKPHTAGSPESQQKIIALSGNLTPAFRRAMHGLFVTVTACSAFLESACAVKTDTNRLHTVAPANDILNTAQGVQENTGDFKNEYEKLVPFEGKLRSFGKMEGGKYAVSDEDAANIKARVKEMLNFPTDVELKIGVGGTGDALQYNTIVGTVILKGGVREVMVFKYDIAKGTLSIDEVDDIKRKDVPASVKKLSAIEKPLRFKPYFKGTGPKGEIVTVEEVDYDQPGFKWKGYKDSFRVTFEMQGKKYSMKITEASRLRDGGTTFIDGTITIDDENGQTKEVTHKLYFPFGGKDTIDGVEFK